jgi:hypothetical protein
MTPTGHSLVMILGINSAKASVLDTSQNVPAGYIVAQSGLSVWLFDWCLANVETKKHT